MSTVYDTLEYDGDEQSFAAWLMSFDTTDELKNQFADVFTATILGADLATETDSPTFPFEAQIIVRTNRSSSSGAANSFSGGTITFSGKRVGNPAKATGNYEGVTYKFLGPWYDLANTHFQQEFYGESDDGDSVPYLIPELVLNTSTAVTAGQIMISVGDQIQAILQWLLDAYTAQGMTLPYQYVGRELNPTTHEIDLNSTDGTYNYLVNPDTTTIDYSLFGLFLPSYIAKPMMCADAIQKCLELSPRVTCSFDYTTNPPTFYAALVNSMVTASLPFMDGEYNSSVNIQARDDLLVRSVNIAYRITDTVNGEKLVSYAYDKWGPNGSNSDLDPDIGLRVVSELIDLTGVSITTTTAHLDVEPVLATTDSGGTDQSILRTWWQIPRGGNVSKLMDSRVRFQDKNGAATTIPSATIKDAETHVVLTTEDLIAFGLCNAEGTLQINRLVSGSVHAWMVNTDGSPVVKKKVHIQTTMVYAEYDATSTAGTPDTDQSGVCARKANTRDHHVDMVITNGLTQAYTALASTTPGEAYIIGESGIAQYLYNHLNDLQYEGEHAKVEVEFGTGVTLRNAINFSGGATVWETMDAQPQSIRRHYGKKTTEVQIGVAKHLNSGQLSALLNMWRFRRPWYNPLLRTQNTPAGGNVDQAIDTGNANTPDGLDNLQQQQILNYTTLPSGSTPGVIGGSIISNPSLLTVHDGFNA